MRSHHFNNHTQHIFAQKSVVYSNDGFEDIETGQEDNQLQIDYSQLQID